MNTTRFLRKLSLSFNSNNFIWKEVSASGSDLLEVNGQPPRIVRFAWLILPASVFNFLNFAWWAKKKFVYLHSFLSEMGCEMESIPREKYFSAQLAFFKDSVLTPPTFKSTSPLIWYSKGRIMEIRSLITYQNARGIDFGLTPRIGRSINACVGKFVATNRARIKKFDELRDT